MEKPAIPQSLWFEDDIPIAPARRRRDDVLVERKGNKHNDHQQVDHRRDRPNSLRPTKRNNHESANHPPSTLHNPSPSHAKDLQFRPCPLRQIPAFETGLNESLAEPCDERKRRGVGDTAEGE